MTLKDLVLETPFSEVINYLRGTMDSLDEELQYQLLVKYRNVYDKLCTIEPRSSSFSTLLILTKSILDKSDLECHPWDTEEFKHLEAHPELVSSWWLDVSGRNLDDPSDTDYYSLSCSPWAEWLSTEIRPRDIKAHGKGNCLAAILYEITFNGFTEEETSNFIEEINNRKREAEEHPETLIPYNPQLTEEDYKEIDRIYQREMESLKRFQEQNIVEDDMRLE